MQLAEAGMAAGYILTQTLGAKIDVPANSAGQTIDSSRTSEGNLFMYMRTSQVTGWAVFIFAAVAVTMEGQVPATVRQRLQRESWMFRRRLPMARRIFRSVAGQVDCQHGRRPVRGKER